MEPDDRSRQLTERARALGLEVAPETAARLLAFVDAMLAKNRVLNLTAVREARAADVLHALDSLAVGLFSGSVRTALDVGSGNGFPGVAVAALWPDARVVLLERTAKKARALVELLAGSAFANTSVLGLDATQVPALQPELRAHFDLVTARAVGAPDLVARVAAPLLRRGAHLVLWLDADAAEPALGVGFDPPIMHRYALPEPAPRTRQLAVARRR